jgi:hypothetical protein
MARTSASVSSLVEAATARRMLDQATGRLDGKNAAACQPDARRKRPSGGAGSPSIFIPVTNLIESINAQLREVTRNRGQFPSEQAALKVLYLAVRNLEGVPTPTPGSAARGGNRQAFTIYFDGRIPTP